jgi:hypothetical protein
MITKTFIPNWHRVCLGLTGLDLLACFDSACLFVNTSREKEKGVTRCDNI